MTRAKTLPFFLISIIVLLMLCLPSCFTKSRKIIEKTKFLMGTIAQIKVSIPQGSDEEKAQSAINKAFEEIGRIENIFTVFRAESEASKINRLRKNEKLQLSEETFYLIKRSIEYSEKTGGTFDITVKPLVDLWNEAKQDNKLPSDDAIKAVLAHTGYQNIVLNERVHTISFKKEGMALDFGGIAKGYATGRAIKVLREADIKDALVRLGGNIYCLGKKSYKELWKVGIQHPRDKDRLFLEIKLKDKAIDTSGDYERYFVLNGKRYSHIIDPRTGYSIGDNITSSSIITDDPIIADALATSLAILGQKGLTIVESVKGTDAVIVFKRDGKFIVKMTEGIKKRYEIFEEKI